LFFTLKKLIFLKKMFFSTTKNMKKCGYVTGIKIIDTWLLFSLFLPFLDMLIQTWTNVCLRTMQNDLRKEVGEVGQRRLRHQRRGHANVATISSQIAAVRPFRSIDSDEEEEKRLAQCWAKRQAGKLSEGSMLISYGHNNFI
jgi:hypothetical protein